MFCYVEVQANFGQKCNSMWQDHSNWWCEKRARIASHHEFTLSFQDHEELHKQMCLSEI